VDELGGILHLHHIDHLPCLYIDDIDLIHPILSGIDYHQPLIVVEHLHLIHLCVDFHLPEHSYRIAAEVHLENLDLPRLRYGKQHLRRGHQRVHYLTRLELETLQRNDVLGAVQKGLVSLCNSQKTISIKAAEAAYPFLIRLKVSLFHHVVEVYQFQNCPFMLVEVHQDLAAGKLLDGHDLALELHPTELLPLPLKGALEQPALPVPIKHQSSIGVHLETSYLLIP
jgi:hypothetical protein